MKKSQIFLGVSTFLLAISGTLAIKASHKTDTKAFLLAVLEALATKGSHKAIYHLAGFTVGGVCQRLGSVALFYTTIRHNNANMK